MSNKESDILPNPREGFSGQIIDYLMDKPRLFSRKSIPVFWPTGVYSLGKCIRSIYNWPSFLSLPVYCDHGSFVGLYLDFHETTNGARHHLTWFKNKYLEKSNKKYGHKKILHITSPQVSYRRKQNYNKKIDSKGTLIFVPHTSGNTEYLRNKKKWISALTTWLEDLIEDINPEKPIVLCFHNTDLKKGYHKELKNKFPIVTAGSSQNENFIDRFYFIISHFNNAIGGTLGSDLFLCQEMGIEYIVYGKKFNLKNIVLTGEDCVDFSDSYFFQKEKKIRDLFLHPKSNSTEKENERKKIIIEHLGLDSTTSENKVKLILVTDFLLLLPYFLASYIKFLSLNVIFFLIKKIFKIKSSNKLEVHLSRYK